MNNLVTDLVVFGDWYEPLEFNSQEELEEYFGEPVSVNFEDEDKIYYYIENWKKDHKFSIIDYHTDSYDLYSMEAIIDVVFTLDEKFYRLSYKEFYEWKNELYEGPYEVIPKEETITTYIRKPSDYDKH